MTEESPRSHLSEPNLSFPILDFLRFGAALAVMLSHLRDVFFAPFGETQAASTAAKAVFYLATRTGQEAVMLFFVISGFLVGGSCIKRLANKTFSLRHYAVDRVSRIYLPLIPVLLITFAAIAWTEGRADPFVLLVNFLSLQGVFADPLEGNGALWSLSYEVWFYILAGAVCVLVSKPRFGPALAALLALGAGGLVFTRLAPQYAFIWIFGALAFCVPRPSRGWPVTIAALIITAIGFVLMQATIESTQVRAEWAAGVSPFAAVMIMGFGCALLVHAASFADAAKGWTARLTPLAARLAAFSYSLYLIHLPAEVVLRRLGVITMHDRLDAASLAAYAAVALLILALAYAFYWCAERHTATVRTWLYRLGRKDAVVAAKAA